MVKVATFLTCMERYGMTAPSEYDCDLCGKVPGKMFVEDTDNKLDVLCGDCLTSTQGKAR